MTLTTKKLSLIFLLFSACSRPGGNGVSIPPELFAPDAEFEGIDGKPLGEARADLKKISLECTIGNCPQGVGLLAAVGQTTRTDTLQQYFVKDACTVSFVKIKNELGVEEAFGITAGHCVPRRLRVGAACADDIAIVLANGKKVGCERVEYVSDSSLDSTRDAYFDIALLKLSSADNLAFYEINRSGLKEAGESHVVHTLAVDPDPQWKKNMKAKLREQDCYYLQSSYVLPASVSPLSPLFMNQDCRLVPGNSGAPLLDGGTIVGIQDSSIAFNPPIFPNGAISIASNVSCLDALHRKNLCESRMDKLFVDKDGYFRHDLYLAFVKNNFANNRAASFDRDTQKLMSLVWQQDTGAPKSGMPSGFGGGWSYVDVQKDSEYYIRLPFPKCVSAKMATGNKGVQSFKVLIYGLNTKRKNLKLNLEGHVTPQKFEIIYLGGGKFQLNTFLNPEGFVSAAVPFCN